MVSETYFMKKSLKKIHQNLVMLGIDPITIMRRWQGVPYFMKNLCRYRTMQKGNRFPAKVKDFYYASFDRFKSAGAANGHYFWQDLWAARYLYNNGIKEHVDVGSRIDGFVSHILTFCDVTYVDVRPFNQPITNLTFVQASILEMPFEFESIHSLSCLHVIEHIGLGRYGGPIDPDGHLKAGEELTRVLSGEGTLLLGTPVGKECLCFDAHRIFDPQTIVEIFSPLSLESFSLVNDRGVLEEKASFEKARRCDYGCGLFIFRRK
jgi:hypothetical protein